MGQVYLGVFPQIHAVGVGSMNLHDARPTKPFQLSSDVAPVVSRVLEVIVYLDAVAPHFLQQPNVGTGILPRAYADGHSFPHSHFAHHAQPGHQRVAHGSRPLPFATTTTQRQKSHLATEDFHGAETVLNELPIVVPGDETLGKETTHGHRSNGHTQTVGRAAKHFRLTPVTQLIVEEPALAERSHVEFHTIGSYLPGKGKLAELLTLEHHPVAGGHAIAGYSLLCADGVCRQK